METKIMAECLLSTDRLIPVCLSDLAAHVYIRNVDKSILEEEVWKQLEIDSYGAVIHKRLVRDINCQHTLRAAVVYDRAIDLSLVVRSLNGKIVGALTITADIAQNITQRYAREEQAEGRDDKRKLNGEVFVTGFSSQVEEKHLADAFSPFDGRTVIMKNWNGKSTNSAVVKFPLESLAISAEIAYDDYCTAVGKLSVTAKRNDQDILEVGWDLLDKLAGKNDPVKKDGSVGNNVEIKPVSMVTACNLPFSALFEMQHTKIAGENKGNEEILGFDEQQGSQQIEGSLDVNEGLCENSESLVSNDKKAETQESEGQIDAESGEWIKELSLFGVKIQGTKEAEGEMDAVKGKEKGNSELLESNGKKQTSESGGSLEAEDCGMKGHSKSSSSIQEAQEIQSEMGAENVSITGHPVFCLKIQEAQETEGEMEAENGESKGDSELSKANNEGRIQEIEGDVDVENGAEGGTVGELELQNGKRLKFVTVEEKLEEIGRSMKELSVSGHTHSLQGACARAQPAIGSQLSPESLNAPVSEHSSMSSSTESAESGTCLQFHLEDTFSDYSEVKK